LLEYEKTNGDSIDISADSFGLMMQDVVKELLNESCDDIVLELSYFLGKWIYLIDALDDFDKDKKKRNYNVFVNSYNDVSNKSELVAKYQREIIYVFSSILLRIEELSKQINYKFNHDLLDNVLLRGLKVQTKQILENEKCKNTTKF